MDGDGAVLGVVGFDFFEGGFFGSVDGDGGPVFGDLFGSFFGDAFGEGE